MNLVKSVQFLFKARNNLFPLSIQELFTAKDGGYALRENLNNQGQTQLIKVCA